MRQRREFIHMTADTQPSSVTTNSIKYPDCGLSPATTTILSENVSMISNTKLIEYANAIQDCLQLDNLNIIDKSRCTTAIIHSWITVHARETKILATLEQRKEAAIKQWISTNGIQEKLVYRHAELARNECPLIKTLDEVIIKQKEVVAFLAESLKVIKDFRWDITNALAALKLENT